MHSYLYIYKLCINGTVTPHSTFPNAAASSRSNPYALLSHSQSQTSDNGFPSIAASGQRDEHIWRCLEYASESGSRLANTCMTWSPPCLVAASENHRKAPGMGMQYF